MAQPPSPPKSRGSSLLLGFLGLVAVAGTGGYLLARARRTTSNPSPTVAAPPSSPEHVVQPPMPGIVPPAPDVAPAVEAPAVPAATVDVPPSPAVVTPDAGAPAEPPPPVLAPPPPVAEVVDAGAAPTPRPTPVARVSPPRVTSPRTVPRPAAAGDAGVAVTPLTEAIRRQDWATARRLLSDGLRARPNDAAAHAQLGYVLDRLGDSRGALAEYRSATRLDRRNTRYLHRLADLQVATGDRPGAIATLQQILRINPAEPAARARLEQMQGAH